MLDRRSTDTKESSKATKPEADGHRKACLAPHASHAVPKSTIKRLQDHAWRQRGPAAALLVQLHRLRNGSKSDTSSRKMRCIPSPCCSRGLQDWAQGANKGSASVQRCCCFAARADAANDAAG